MGFLSVFFVCVCACMRITFYNWCVLQSAWTTLTLHCLGCHSVLASFTQLIVCVVIDSIGLANLFFFFFFFFCSVVPQDYAGA